MRINLDDYRLPNGTIDILEAYTHLYGKPNDLIKLYVGEAMSIHPIKSRQLAALVIATARVQMERRPL